MVRDIPHSNIDGQWRLADALKAFWYCERWTIPVGCGWEPYCYVKHESM